jgi:hypothetical protein
MLSAFTVSVGWARVVTAPPFDGSFPESLPRNGQFSSGQAKDETYCLAEHAILAI